MMKPSGQHRSSSLADNAVSYGAAGWAVLPVRRRGKEPLTPHGFKDATTDVETIRRWWRKWPAANIGLAVPPGFLVLDIDSADALNRLRAEDLHLPATSLATTGRGRHIWYATGEVAVRNRVAILPGVDVRAPGSYVVAPPSQHSSGRIYRWEVKLERSAIAGCPEWLLSRLTASSNQTGLCAEEWHRKIRERVPRGWRNQTLTQVAGLLFRKLPAGVAAELAYCWAQVKLSPPLPEREVQRTIESIAGRELRKRVGPP